jgi:hypothetical protein
LRIDRRRHPHPASAPHQLWAASTASNRQQHRPPLLAQHTNDLIVAGVAKWGLQHLGNFANRYRYEKAT